MNKKKLTVTLVTIIAISTMATGCGKTAKLKTDKETAVKLTGGKITANDFYKELKKENIETLINMIDHKILDKKYTTTEEETTSINNQISQMKSYYKDNEAGYLSAIKSYFGVESEEELRTVLSLEYKRGQAVNDYVEDHIKDDEIESYYKDNIYGDIKASHILISVKTSDDMNDEDKEKEKQKALKKAKEVIEKLNNGEKFKDLAKEYSDDDTNNKKGGNLGYFNKDDMDSNFWNAALNLKKNEYTKEPIETSYGYHIILKTGEKKKDKLEDVKDTIKEKIAKDKLNNDRALFYETLINIRKDKKITFGDSELEKLYNDYMEKLIDNAKQTTNNNAS